MKKLKFITSNKHKVKEIQMILDDFDVELEQVQIDYPEDKEDDMEAVARKASKNLAEQLGEPVIVEDTGIFFKAYNNFPGAQPKFVFNGIGFDGIFRLLAGKDRGAYFKTVIGYCEPGKEPINFIGEAHGDITEDIREPDKDLMPYTHIFQYEGYSEATAEMPLEEKLKYSQRGKAARKLGEFLKKKHENS